MGKKRLVARFCAFWRVFEITFPPPGHVGMWFNLVGFWWPQVEGKAWLLWQVVRHPDRIE